MSPSPADGAMLPPDFIAAQKVRLEQLRDQLIATADGAGREEQGLQNESVDEVRDSADSAETMAIEENDEALFRRNLQRLVQVRRALEKIEQGSYGRSDVSDEPIPQARLQAVPESTRNVGEPGTSE